MNPVVHFELPVDDRDRAGKFYSQVFGWKMEQLGPDMGEYTLAQTGETDEKGLIKKPGMINGGLFKKSDTPADNVVSVVISVDHLEEHMKKVQEVGGTLQGEPMEIPGVGRFIGIIDTEGNRIGMLQPAENT